VCSWRSTDLFPDFTVYKSKKLCRTACFSLMAQRLSVVPTYLRCYSMHVFYTEFPLIHEKKPWYMTSRLRRWGRVKRRRALGWWGIVLRYHGWLISCQLNPAWFGLSEREVQASKASGGQVSSGKQKPLLRPRPTHEMTVQGYRGLINPLAAWFAVQFFSSLFKSTGSLFKPRGNKLFTHMPSTHQLPRLAPAYPAPTTCPAPPARAARLLCPLPPASLEWKSLLLSSAPSSRCSHGVP